MEIKKKQFDENIYKIINGDSMKVLDTLEENSVDSVVTDPPYGLTTITKRFGKENSAPAQFGKDGSFARLSKGFMGKEWDGSGIEYNVEFWSKAWRVLKPGGYLLAFGGSRTFHRIACAIEDAGFEIRDTIMWLYGSGFPKSMNIGLAIDKKNGVDNTTGNIKTDGSATDSIVTTGIGTLKREYKEREAQNEWKGWGTCLKPAFEPIIVARKPVEDSVINNVIKYGVGGINIDECRVPLEENDKVKMNVRDTSSCSDGWNRPWMEDKEKDRLRQEIAIEKANNLGRFPSNVILTYDETDFDEVCGGMPNTKSNGSESNYEFGNQDNPSHLYTNVKSGIHFDDEGSAARYFYCAKASKKDRDSGLDMLEERAVNDGRKTDIDNAFQRGITPRKNIHPTVKPVELMQYLIRLVSPKGATILDPFNGSGSTGKAVAFENREREMNYKYVGIELDPEYCEISKGRIDYALNKFEYDMIQDIKKEEQETGQMSLFDIDYEN